MKSERIARDLVAVAAWFTLALVVFMVVEAFIPSILEALNAVTPGSVSYLLIKVLTVVVMVILLGGWGATVWHAAVNPAFKSAGQRAAVIGMILFANALSPFFYYFGYLCWAARPTRSPAAV